MRRLNRSISRRRSTIASRKSSRTNTAPRSPYCSLAIPITGLGAWASNKATAEIDDAGLRALAKKNQPLKLPNGVTFAMTDAEQNVAFCSQWDNYPKHVQATLTGRASHVFLLMAGSTNPMQSRFENGAVIVEYADGSTSKLSLRNPETWWPIEQDYFVDDYQFRYDASLPIRVDLKTAKVQRSRIRSSSRARARSSPAALRRCWILPWTRQRN